MFDPFALFNPLPASLFPFSTIRCESGNPFSAPNLVFLNTVFVYIDKSGIEFKSA